jgi:hypothetical protein
MPFPVVSSPSEARDQSEPPEPYTALLTGFDAAACSRFVGRHVGTLFTPLSRIFAVTTAGKAKISRTDSETKAFGLCITMVSKTDSETSAKGSGKIRTSRTDSEMMAFAILRGHGGADLASPNIRQQPWGASRWVHVVGSRVLGLGSRKRKRSRRYDSFDRRCNTSTSRGIESRKQRMLNRLHGHRRRNRDQRVQVLIGLARRA